MNGDDAGPAERGNGFGPLRPGSLSTVVHAYKAAVTRWVRRHGYVDFGWQPRYYDRVIRTERERRATRDYVVVNPAYWDEDRLHQ